MLAAPNKNEFRGPFRKLRYYRAVSSCVARHEAVSTVRIVAELIFLYITRRFSASLYFSARLWRQDMTLAEKMRFMNDKQYRKRVHELNPIEYIKLSRHKLAEKSILTMLGIPTPKFIGFLHPSKGCDTSLGAVTNTDNLSDLLRAQSCRRICFKMAEGRGGKGFVAAELSIDDGDVRLRNLACDDDFISVREFEAKYLAPSHDDGMLIEEYIQQHEIPGSLNPSSVNTIRIWLIQKGESVQVIGAVFRMGRKSQVVDNTANNGLIAIVDVETGILGPVINPQIIPGYCAQHPDSGTRAEGLELPYWNECVELAKQALRVFPVVTFAGLDIAIVDQGPMVLELNLMPDKISARNFNAPTSDLLA